jgi:hypothetical protein
VASETPETSHPDTSVTSAATALQDNSLKGAGYSLLLADCALIASGLKAGKGKEAFGGVYGLLAGFVGSRYGNPNAETQLKLTHQKLGAYLKQQGIEIPEKPDAKELTKEGGVLHHIESFLYAHPSQVMNVLYSMVGLQFLRSGLQQNTFDMKASGSLLIAGALSGLLISEKAPDPENPPEGAVNKLTSWIQEKPLRLTGTLFSANQFFLAKDALRERREHPEQKSYMFKMLAVAAFVLGNTLISLSSKSHGGGSKMDEETMGKLADTAAHIVAAQPREMQETLLEHMAGFLAAETNIDMSSQQISALFHAKMEEVRGKHEELGNGSWQQRLSSQEQSVSQHASL